MSGQRDPRLPPTSDPGEGLRDWGSHLASGTQFDDQDYAGHRFEQSLYAGLEMHEHGPRTAAERRRHHRRKHRHRDRDRNHDTGGKSPHAPPSTPPSERVQFLLGSNQDDDDEDHATHDIFCEMSELMRNDSEDPDDWQWKEVARWVKFEEDVEEGGERWSKPFVATLSLYSLLEVRKCLMTGSCLLDCDADGLDKVAELIIENMVNSKLLKEEDRGRVIDIILRRHRHLHEKKRGESGRGLSIVRSLADIGRKKSEPNAMGHRMSLSVNNNHHRGSLFSRKFSTPEGLMNRKYGGNWESLSLKPRGP